MSGKDRKSLFTAESGRAAAEARWADQWAWRPETVVEVRIEGDEPAWLMGVLREMVRRGARVSGPKRIRKRVARSDRPSLKSHLTQECACGKRQS